jgi:hypothetical protein
LSRANSRGFVFGGSGDVTVITPSFYRPGRIYVLEVGDAQEHLVADRSGRLTFKDWIGSKPRRVAVRVSAA